MRLDTIPMCPEQWIKWCMDIAKREARSHKTRAARVGLGQDDLLSVCNGVVCELAETRDELAARRRLRNAIRNAIKGEERRLRRQMEHVRCNRVSPLEAIRAIETTDLESTFLRRLPRLQKQSFRLMNFAGYSSDQAGAILGVSGQAVRRANASAMRTIRKIFLADVAKSSGGATKECEAA